jgi:hypothetical protein
MREPIWFAGQAANWAPVDYEIDELGEGFAACNNCHQATNFGFNRVQRPESNPYPNQLFAAAR